MSDWLDELQGLPIGRVVVEHAPRTPRYDRASAKLRYLLTHSCYLGARPTEPSSETSVEVALWAPNPTGRGPGFYSCVRLFHREGRATSALLFAFYDGTERSVGLKSCGAARFYAYQRGFREVPDDDTGA